MSEPIRVPTELVEHSMLVRRIHGFDPHAAASKALRESVGRTAPIVATTGGDPALLRGIPVVGAVPGVMRGTRPDRVVR